MTGSKKSLRRDSSDSEQELEQDDEVEGFRSRISKGVANYMWEESKQKARKAFSIYGNIDILRPYYDVEPKEVVQRLLSSLLPKMPSSLASSKQSVPREMYGPTMLVLTMIAMLLFEMKSSGHVIQEGTLMGTAFGTCFGYWIGVSCLIWVTTYVCNTRVTLLQILHLLGYALFGHCLVLFLTTLFHPTHSHLYFYSVWLLLGGLSTLRMISVFVSRTSGRSQKLILSSVIATFHLLFLLYLHFSYHRVVEELSGPIAQRPAPLGPQEPLGPQDSKAMPPDSLPSHQEEPKVNIPAPDKQTDTKLNVIGQPAGDGQVLKRNEDRKVELNQPGDSKDKPADKMIDKGNKEEGEANEQEEEGEEHDGGGGKEGEAGGKHKEGGEVHHEEGEQVEGAGKVEKGEVIVTLSGGYKGNRTNLLNRLAK